MIPSRQAPRPLTASQAFTLCARVAQECTEASGKGEYGSGYRAAGDWMKREILRVSAGRSRTAIEREIRDVEIKARMLASVVLVAERVVAALDRDDPAADAVRALVAELYDRADIPPTLRARVDLQSHTRVACDPASCREVGQRRPA
jgi:hypothetical protein